MNYRDKVLAKAIKHLEAARELLANEADREDNMRGPGPDYAMVGSLRHYADQIDEVIECDNGEAGVKAFASQIAGKAVRL